MATEDSSDGLAVGVFGKCACVETIAFAPKGLIESSRNVDALLRPHDRISTHSKVVDISLG